MPDHEQPDPPHPANEPGPPTRTSRSEALDVELAALDAMLPPESPPAEPAAEQLRPRDGKSGGGETDPGAETGPAP